MRIKHRFLVCQLVWKDGIAADDLTEQTVLSAVREGVRDVCGELVLGQALAGLQVLYLNTYSYVVVLRSTRDATDAVMAALASTSTLQLRRVHWQVHAVAGNLKTCQERALHIDNTALLARLKTLPASHQATARAQQAKLQGLWGGAEA